MTVRGWMALSMTVTMLRGMVKRSHVHGIHLGDQRRGSR